MGHELSVTGTHEYAAVDVVDSCHPSKHESAPLLEVLVQRSVQRRPPLPGHEGTQLFLLSPAVNHTPSPMYRVHRSAVFGRSAIGSLAHDTLHVSGLALARIGRNFADESELIGWLFASVGM